jgi:hypothetical protein
MITQRNSRGNILILVVLATGIIVAAGVIGFIFNGFLFDHTRSQYKVDALALSLACSINSGDRVGEINELEECSRELIYVSRERFENCAQQDLGFLEPLCYELLDEARSGQELVERERKNQIALICKQIQKAANDYNKDSTNRRSTFNLGWLQTSEPRIEQIFVGRIAKIQSSVKSLDVIAELDASDYAQDYIDATTKLFKADVDARLPEDSDLSFDICSLPAYVEGTCAPARNTNPEAFIPSSTLL